jgi:hypothetical protein
MREKELLSSSYTKIENKGQNSHAKSVRGCRDEVKEKKE